VPEEETPAQPVVTITEEANFDEVPIEGTPVETDESDRTQNEDEREPTDGPLFGANLFVTPQNDADDEPIAEVDQETDKEDDLDEGPQENSKEDDLDQLEEEEESVPAATTEVEEETPATNDADKPTSGEEEPSAPEDEEYFPTKYFFDDDKHEQHDDPLTTDDNATTVELNDEQSPDEVDPSAPANEGEDPETE